MDDLVVTSPAVEFKVNLSDKMRSIVIDVAIYIFFLSRELSYPLRTGDRIKCPLQRRIRRKQADTRALDCATGRRVVSKLDVR